MRIYIDAMGGDRAPDAVIAGIKLAAKEVKAKLIILGDESVLAPQLGRLKRLDLDLINCTETITMSEQPVQAVRSKKDSSIVRGLQLCAENPDDAAFFSAGHSGAVFAAALLAMGRLKGVERPAIATALPTIKGRCIFLDAGANVDCRPAHLVQFACMGTTYARIYLKHDQPTVGLLSNGEEESKGTELTRAAHAALKSDDRINYVGYVEGNEIFAGAVDVVVTDGFTGNVVLKSLEGLGHTFSSLLRTELKSSALARLGYVFSLPALRKLQSRLDYAKVGAAPLLGVDGNCFIGHGHSNARAIKNGILRAQEAIELNLHPMLRNQFKNLREEE